MISEITNGGCNTNSRFRILELRIRQTKKMLEKLTTQEKKIQAKWTRGYRTFGQAAQQLTEVKSHQSKKFKRLSRIVHEWKDQTTTLTKQRDDIRSQKEKVKEELTVLTTQLVVLQEQEENRIETDDGIVAQVFLLNATAVQAAHAREDYLTVNLFPRLGEEDGKHRSQISITSSTGLRRVVALVNTITIVLPNLAEMAQGLIQKFFERFRKEEGELPPTIKPFYEISSQLLITKTGFKVGPTLYRFLGMRLDPELCQELVEAQSLLKASIRSEKTSNYIRIYERSSRNEKWQVVKQS